MSSDPGSFGLSRLAQIAINVGDVDRATRFYRDTLGMRFLFSAPPGLAFFDCDGIRLMLAKPERPELDHPSSILYFRVDDVKEAHRRLEGRGVEFVEPPGIVHRASTHDLWMAAFRDTEGNVLAVMAEVPTEAPRPQA